MRWFRAKAEAAAEGADPQKLSVRQTVRRCFECGLPRGLYVYAEDGNDYCVPCARDLWVTRGLRPAGRRNEDITLDELIQYETGGPRPDDVYRLKREPRARSAA